MVSFIKSNKNNITITHTYIFKYNEFIKFENIIKKRYILIKLSFN